MRVKPMQLLFTATAAGVAYVAGHGLFGLIAIVAFVWATSMAGTANTAKTRNVEDRLGGLVVTTAPAVNLVNNGGTIGGTVTVQGDHHIQGTLYGSGGVLSVGDDVDANGNVSAGNDISASGNLSTSKTTSTQYITVAGTQWSQMSSEGAQGLGSSGFGGGSGFNATAISDLVTLQSQMNSGIGALNNLMARLQSQGFMSY